MAGPSDLAQIGRLKEEEELALKDTEDKIQQYKKFEDDYTALKKKLSKLPDKVTHPVMVFVFFHCFLFNMPQYAFH